MISELFSASKQVGLDMHMGKTKVLSNVPTARRGSLRVGGQTIQILALDESTDDLGRKLCVENIHDVELDARLDKAWRNFFFDEVRALRQKLPVAFKIGALSSDGHSMFFVWERHLDNDGCPRDKN